jgi:uncharacterized membrane protein YccC
MAARAVNTAAGGAIALLAYGLWPTWERTQVGEGLARLLDAYRNYFRSIREAYINAQQGSSNGDAMRDAARRARTNLEASVTRFTMEPGASAQAISALESILAVSHRLAHAMMALESGLWTSQPASARPEFVQFANDVELTLYFLASGLRGSPVARETLPDLRERHHALVRAGDSETERYALVNVETDRLTNSLNTLSEEILRWVA